MSFAPTIIQMKTAMDGGQVLLMSMDENTLLTVLQIKVENQEKFRQKAEVLYG